MNNKWEGDVTLSHSGKWIVVALTTKGSIRVDVEEIIPRGHIICNDTG